jgi:Zn-finger nucleic acid-binding protein
MAQCSSCSAPLPANTCLCSYCGTRNDMDFAAVNRFTIAREPSRRLCPDCAIQLETVRVSTGAGLFAIERCRQCYGLFFDVGEVQAFLEASISPAFAVNLREIATINEERGDFNRPIRYIKCPECDTMMNRVNYGSKSGVVVDQCKEHGMWLDNGELVHLMEWKKAGGDLLPKHEPATREPKEYQRPNSPFPMTTPYQETSIATDVVSVACSILLDIF